MIGGTTALFAAATLFLSKSYEVMRNPFFIVPFIAVLSILVITLSVKFCLCFYFVIDKGLDPIKSLKASSRTTEGAKLSLFFFFVICSLINSVGNFCIGASVITKMLTLVILGVIFIIAASFITWPMFMVATALAYRQLSEQTPELGINSPNVRAGSAVGCPLNTAGVQLDPAIQAVINARPDQNTQSKVVAQRAADKQLIAYAQSSQSIQHEQGADTRLEVGKKADKSFFLWLAVLVLVSIAFAAGIFHRLWSGTKKSAANSQNGVAATLKKVAVASKKAAATPKGVAATAKETTAAQKGGIALKVILYSEENPSALIDGEILKEGDVIDGVKIVKINKDTVEFEKEGERWTQHTK
jgi:hypothetical protein